MEWLKGKKTFIAAGIVAVVGVVGFFLGQLDLTHAGLVIGFAAGMVGLGDKWDRYGGLFLAGLEDLKKKDIVTIKVTPKSEAPTIGPGPSATASSVDSSSKENPAQ